MESVAERSKLEKPESEAEPLELTDKAGESMSAENVESADLCAERNPEDEEELGEEDDIEDEEGGEDEDEGRVFSVGEFVWGKIKHHPWWPGQIYDASDASDLAIKHKPKDKDLYLVAYFGDGTFSWCSGAQLKSFDENFEYLSHQSSLKSFEYAVEDALSVIGELMVLEMTCACVKRDGQVGFNRPVAENAGVRKGVLVPMVGVDGLPVVRFDAAEIVASVRNAARSVSVKNSLELTMLSSKLLAFYHAKGYHELPKFQFPVYIDGLEDISKSSNDIDVPVDDLVSNEDGQTPLANSSEKARTLQGDKLYGRRKQKSLADIIREETDTDVLNGKEGKETLIRRRGTKKQKRVGQNDSEKKGNLSTLVKGKKKAKSSQKTNSCEDTKVEMADTTSADNNGRSDSLEIDVAVKSKGRKRMATMSGEKDGPAKSRDKKRKKDSLTPIASIKQAGFEPVLLDLRTDARVGERMSKAAKLIIESPSIRKHCSSIDPVATEMLPGIKPVTVSPLPERPIDSKLDVFSLKKASDLDTLMDDDDDDDDDGRPMSVILFLTFSNGESLPSKTDLLAKYRQFGSLNEEETDVLPNSHCAQVVFIKKFEGEQAFEDMVKMNSADSGVHYRIRYVPRGSKVGKLDGSMLSKPSPQPGKFNNDAHPVSVSYLKQKFEAVMSKLNNVVEEDELSDELKKELHSELTILLEKLS